MLCYALLCYAILFFGVLEIIHRWENHLIYHPNQDSFDILQSQNEILLCKRINLLKSLKDHRGRWGNLIKTFYGFWK